MGLLESTFFWFCLCIISVIIWYITNIIHLNKSNILITIIRDIFGIILSVSLTMVLMIEIFIPLITRLRL